MERAAMSSRRFIMMSAAIFLLGALPFLIVQPTAAASARARVGAGAGAGDRPGRGDSGAASTRRARASTPPDGRR